MNNHGAVIFLTASVPSSIHLRCLAGVDTGSSNVVLIRGGVSWSNFINWTHPMHFILVGVFAG